MGKTFRKGQFHVTARTEAERRLDSTRHLTGAGSLETKHAAKAFKIVVKRTEEAYR